MDEELRPGLANDARTLLARRDPSGLGVRRSVGKVLLEVLSFFA
jgi:hypothetical protein